MLSIGTQVAADNGLSVKYDREVLLGTEFIEAIRRGPKTHTIKFHQEGGRDVIRLPLYSRLPLLEKVAGSAPARKVAVVDFDYVRVERFGELSEEDAISDGFSSEETFRIETENLARQRGFNLTPQSRVSVYHIAEVFWI